MSDPERRPMPQRRALQSASLLIMLVGFAAGSPQPTMAAPESPAFHDFLQRVRQYMKLQKAVPRLRTTNKAKEIVDRRHALAQSIREARSDAKQGDMFTPDVTAEFTQIIRNTFRGTGAPGVRKTIRQGEPLAGWRLAVNGDYPDHLPLTTVPPTLLQRLPQLPSGVAYRIIGHDLVLEDTEARLIVDFLLGVIP
jgi:hypothetical protein